MKLGLVGTGMIATEVLDMLGEYFPGQVEVTCVYSRNRSVEKARQLAARYHIPKVYTVFDIMLSEQEVDFIYVANANHVHFEYARMALEAGKNVIVEKPLCPTVGETQTLIQLALRKNLYLFEAVSTLHLPNLQKVAELLPELGKIRIVECNFSQYSSRYDRYLAHDVAPVFDPRCAGGALLDVNVYNVNFVVGLFGMPVGAKYYPNLGYNGVDTSGTLIMRYPDFVATCTGAKDCAAPSFCMVQGEKGWIRVEGTPNEFREIRLHVGTLERTYTLNAYKCRLVHEFEEFFRMYREKNLEKMKLFLDLSLNVIKTLEIAKKTEY